WEAHSIGGSRRRSCTLFCRSWPGKYLAVPVASAALERLFSVAGNTITEQRSSLTDKNAENVIFLYSNQSMW
ncbi:unnamed protein product, partial [Laminaria digitata]